MNRALGLALSALVVTGCQSDIEYQALVFVSGVVISRADFDEGTCTILIVTDEVEEGEQEVSGVKIVHHDPSHLGVAQAARYGSHVLAREVSLAPEDCKPTTMEGEPLGQHGSGKIRFEDRQGTDEDGYYLCQAHVNAKIGGVRFNADLDLHAGYWCQ
jgi:hypothetical protein